MTTATELTERLLVALRGVPGLRPSTPPTAPAAAGLPWDWATMAIDIEVDIVHVRLAATQLPLPPLLVHAGAVLRPVLAGTAWSAATLRLVVTDVDRSALGRGSG